MYLQAAILLLLAWLGYILEPASACPHAMPIDQVREIGRGHQALHQVARIAAAGSVPACILGLVLLRRARQRMLALARTGICLRDAKHRERCAIFVAGAIAVIPPVVFITLSFLLDANIAWQCSLSPEVDFVGERAVQLTQCTAAVIGIAVVKAWGRRRNP